MKIGRIELTDPAKPVDIGDGDRTAIADQQPLRSQFLHCAADVGRRQPQDIGEQIAAKRQLIRSAVIQAPPKTDDQLAKEMRQMGHCAAAAKIERPLA